MDSEKRKEMRKQELNAAVKVQTKLQQGRIDLNNNIIPPPIIEIPREELYQNINNSEKMLKDSLVKLGLTYARATDVTTNMNVDLLLKVNAYWNHFVTEIPKKFNLKAISSLFLVDYFKAEVFRIENSVIEQVDKAAVVEADPDREMKLLEYEPNALKAIKAPKRREAMAEKLVDQLNVERKKEKVAKVYDSKNLDKWLQLGIQHGMKEEEEAVMEEYRKMLENSEEVKQKEEKRSAKKKRWMRKWKKRKKRWMKRKKLKRKKTMIICWTCINN
jgi:hypothetical protein